jgi:hypothetical protein
VEWGIGNLKSKWRMLMKFLFSTKEKYNHLFRVVALLITFLHKLCQGFIIEVIGEHHNDPTKYGWDGDY